MSYEVIYMKAVFLAGRYSSRISVEPYFKSKPMIRIREIPIFGILRNHILATGLTNLSSVPVIRSV
jgi:hypothetical protein